MNKKFIKYKTYIEAKKDSEQFLGVLGFGYNKKDLHYFEVEEK